MLRQRRAAWLIALPVATGSWLNAHCLAYVLVPPDGAGHAHHHVEGGGHTYFGSMPVMAAALVTVLAAGLALCVSDGLRGRGAGARSRPPALLFALLPPFGFVVQEHVETLIVSGSLSAGLLVEPTFLTGLALQLPFGVAALLLTRALYALGYGLGRVLARGLPAARPIQSSPLTVTRIPQPPSLRAPSVLALCHGSRAPPATALS